MLSRVGRRIIINAPCEPYFVAAAECLPTYLIHSRWSSRVSAATQQFYSNDRGSSDKKLFTPGPLGCSRTVKEAMLRDLGSRDVEFIDTVKQIRRKLLEIAGVTDGRYTVVPLQGSGTYAVEAVLQSMTPRDGMGRILILANGAYGQRMEKICSVAGIPCHFLDFSETEFVDPFRVEAHLCEKNSSGYTAVAIVHSETSSGVVNPVEHIGQLVKKHAPRALYFVDAMSSFGVIPLDLQAGRMDFVVSSANKCLEGVPGFSYVVADREKLQACKGNCRSLSLDIVDQWEGLESSGQFRFTPPTHSMLAFRQALAEYESEGGLQGRAKRYRENSTTLRAGMKKLGFRELLADDHQGYIITSFHYPRDARFDFSEFYRRLNDLGQVIYPGKVTTTDCFRIGNIGHLFPEDMQHLLACVESVCVDMGMSVPVH